MLRVGLDKSWHGSCTLENKDLKALRLRVSTECTLPKALFSGSATGPRQRIPIPAAESCAVVPIHFFADDHQRERNSRSECWNAFSLGRGIIFAIVPPCVTFWDLPPGRITPKVWMSIHEPPRPQPFRPAQNPYRTATIPGHWCR